MQRYQLAATEVKTVEGASSFRFTVSIMPEIVAVIVYASRFSCACSMPSCACEIPISACEILFCDACFLLSGTKATVMTDTYHEQNVVIIPYDSVYYDGAQAYVYTVVEGKAKKTNVSTGLYDIEQIVITEGLTKEDTDKLC